MSRWMVCLALLATVVSAGPGLAQDPGGEPGGSGCGDVFGDLVEIQRDAVSGVPILAQRWIELPRELPGYGWGYCPIAVDAAGNQIPFLPLTCDPDPAFDAVEVDYFGRLSAGRTKERNIRMHFDEVVSSIKAAGIVKLDPGGRLMLGTACTGKGQTLVCASWATIDSPQENLALYHRVTKYGHIQTDPAEIDLSSHGDPAAPTQYHPALGPEDWVKLRGHLRWLLPEPNMRADTGACFGQNGSFVARCAESEALQETDFEFLASFLGGAAGKTGKITADLVQYLNRILKSTQDTSTNPEGGTTPAVNRLPAKVRDCWEGPDPVLPVDPDTGEVIREDPVYGPCAVYGATTDLPNYSLFTVVQEEFVNFGEVDGAHLGAIYNRLHSFGATTMQAIVPPPGDPNPTTFTVNPALPLLPWLNHANPGMEVGRDIHGFDYNASDALRAIEFIHNYEVPAPLWDFVTP